MQDYKECYVAFMDLLGFKQMIQSRSCGEMVDIFNEIRTEYTITCDKTPWVKGGDINMKVMSDSICIFVQADLENSLPALISLCAYFQVRMLRFSPPVLVRGGIAKGDIYFDGDVIFGNGLIRAYLLESNNAKVPRIIVTKNLIDTYSSCDDGTKVFMQGMV